MRSNPSVESSDFRANAARAIGQLEASCDVRDTTVSGVTIRWRVCGKGAPLILLHGGHGSWLHWIRNIEPLSRKFQVFVPDMPGFNDSGDLPETRGGTDGLDELVTALAEGAKAAIGGDAPICMMGFSFGALVAAKLTSRLANVRRLVLLGPAGHGFPRRQTQELLDWRKAKSSAERGQALRENLSTFMFRSSASVDELAMTIHEQACIRTRFRSKAISRAGLLPQALAMVACPVMMIWGESDVTAAPEQVAVELCRARTDWEWVVVRDAGHWVQYERADEVNKLVLGWMHHQTIPASN